MAAVYMPNGGFYMRKSLNAGLLQYQRNRRNETCARIEGAIKVLSNEKNRLTISNIARKSGLSQSVFTKPHVRKLLNDRIRKSSLESQQNLEQHELINVKVLEKKCMALQSHLARLLNENERIKIAYQRLENKLKNEAISNQKLRGEIEQLERELMLSINNPQRRNDNRDPKLTRIF
jgi:uncharacterized protein YhaN